MCRRSACSTVFIFIFFLLLDQVSPDCPNHIDDDLIDYDLAKKWAKLISDALSNMSDFVTRKKDVQNSYKGTQIETIDGSDLAREISHNLHSMMETRTAAVERIVETAESIVANLRRDPRAPLSMIFFNSKEDQDPRPTNYPVVKLKYMSLKPNDHFDNKLVNISYSSVHVPTDVFDWSNDTMKAIWWSDNLDSVFIENYNNDPTLSWQYFGSASGIMRHFPAMRWDDEPVDLYDCRTRAWYIEAAVSPKDMIILIDVSGSMTGTSLEVGIQTVYNILDTLSNNDFVNVFMMINNTVIDVVDCFSDTLIQANLANIRELKLGLKNFEPHGIANFDMALTKAFELLKKFQIDRSGADCNQAIMIITDGIYENYHDIFKKYNFQNIQNIPVRVFTYLIGYEVADTREEVWMACANRGYFSELTNVAEVRKKVLQYVPVMSRPLALYGDNHPEIWTPVYANIIDPIMTDYSWEKKQELDQKVDVKAYRRNMTVFKSEVEQMKRKTKILKEEFDQYSDGKPYMLMTSVSKPVYNKTKLDPTAWNLLGVAGTDVPISDIKIKMKPYKLGVNGYAFIVTNNGYILIHPDFRPLFYKILKPGYTTVDVLEVELNDDDNEPRDFHKDMMNFRNDIIQQENGTRKLHVKYHYDNMRRASNVERKYDWTGIKKTPFSLVIALPEPYGTRKIKGDENFHKSIRSKNANLNYLFKLGRFKIHPEWLYCRDYKLHFENSEEELFYFLKLQKWKSQNKPSASEYIICDEKLFELLLFDAKKTEWFYQDIFRNRSEKVELMKLIDIFGIRVTFIATHSGLTRWFPLMNPEPNMGEEEFGIRYPKSIDELWYKRAVEYNSKDSDSYIYSIELDIGDSIVDEKLEYFVMVSHAVFVKNEKSVTAPAAVVGYEFQHKALHGLFVNVTFNCYQYDCEKTCQSNDFHCYLIDENAYVIASKSLRHTGTFFGEIKPEIMYDLINDEVYKPIRIPDYQAVCFEEKSNSDRASSLITPFMLINQGLNYLITYFLWICNQFSLISTTKYRGYNYSFHEEEEDFEMMKKKEQVTTTTEAPKKKKKKKDKKEEEKEREKQFMKWTDFNKTEAKPCDHEVTLYRLQEHSEEWKNSYRYHLQTERKYYAVEYVKRTNLLLIVVNKLCPSMNIKPMSIRPTEVNHNDTLACIRVANTKLIRKSLPDCVKHHPNESKIEMCGKSSNLSQLKFVYLFLTTLMVISATILIQ